MARKKQAQPGHNSAPADTLLAYIERIERLEEEKKTIAFEITEVKREAKGRGLDVKTIVKIVKERGNYRPTIRQVSRCASPAKCGNKFIFRMHHHN